MEKSLQNDNKGKVKLGDLFNGGAVAAVGRSTTKLFWPISNFSRAGQPAELAAALGVSKLTIGEFWRMTQSLISWEPLSLTGDRWLILEFLVPK